MIESGKNRVAKYIEVLDIIALITYGFMIFTSLSRTAKFLTAWPNDWYSLQELSIKVWLVIAVIKLILFFETSKKEVIAATILLGLTVVGKFVGINNYLYVVAPIVMFFRTPFQKIARCYLTIVGTNLIIIVLYALMDVIPDYYIPISGRGDRLIHHLGFSNHNAIMAYWLFIFLTAICLLGLEKKRHIRLIFLTALLSISGILYYLTDSKTSFLLILAMGLIVLVEWIIPNKVRSPYCKRIQDVIFRGMHLVPLFAIIVTAAGTLIYNITGYRGTGAISTLFSRYYLLNNALESVGVRLPHQTINLESINQEISFNWLIGTGADNLGGGDILYGNLLLRDGLIAVVLYLVIQFYMLYKAYKNKNHIFFLVLVLLAVFGCTESCALDIAFSVFSCLLFADWTKWDKQEQMISSDKYDMQQTMGEDSMVQNPHRKKLYFAIGCGIYILFTIGLFSQFNEKTYNTFSHLPTDGLIRQSINGDGIQQFFQTNDLRGLRLYLYNPENIEEGTVVVRIREAETDRILFQDEIPVGQLAKEAYFNYKEYVDVLSDAILPVSESGYLLDISVNEDLFERLVYYTAGEILVFKTLNKSIPFSLIGWNMLTCYGIYASVCLIYFSKSSSGLKKNLVISHSNSKGRWLLILIVFPMLLIGLGWLTKDTFHYERQLIQIGNGDFISTIILEPNQSYLGGFQVKDKPITEIQVDLLNSWEEIENYTIAIETKDGDIIATEEGKNLEKNDNNALIWDISEIALEKNEFYDFCIFTGEFGNMSMPIIESVSCIYGKDYHSKIRYFVFMCTAIISFVFVALYNERFAGNKKYVCILLWVLLQTGVSFWCSNGLFIWHAGTMKQKIVLAGVSIGTIICAISCCRTITKNGNNHDSIKKMMLMGLLLPFVSCMISRCLDIAPYNVVVPFGVIISMFAEIALAYFLMSLISEKSNPIWNYKTKI